MVISKMGAERVRNSTVPRTSPMTEAMSPALYSASGLGVQPVFIAERQVVKQVFDSFNASLGKPRGDALAHALDVLYRRCELQAHGFEHSSAFSLDNGC